jgi:hypothetical protein
MPGPEQSIQQIVARTGQRFVNANLTGTYLAAPHSLPILAPDAHLPPLGALSERLRRLPMMANRIKATLGP